MSTTNATEAARTLHQIASRGRSYRNDEVYYSYRIETGTESYPAGTGLDLERTVCLPDPAGTANAISGQAALRVLRKINGNLFLRAKLTWTSPFGEHTSYAGYDLTEATVEQLDSLIRPDEDEVDPESLDMETAMQMIDDSMSSQDALGASWHQSYPDFTGEIIEYHGSAVLTAREQIPGMLNMLSDSDMGAFDPQEVIDLLDWLRQQPEVSALL